MPRVKKSYPFYADCGHGWLKVEFAELVRLGIEKKITSYSYMLGPYVYLEEDQDLSTFFDAKCEVDGVVVKLQHKWSSHSRIRNYQSYDVEMCKHMAVLYSWDKETTVKLFYKHQIIHGNLTRKGNRFELMAIGRYRFNVNMVKKCIDCNPKEVYI